MSSANRNSALNSPVLPVNAEHSFVIRNMQSILLTAWQAHSIQCPHFHFCISTSPPLGFNAFARHDTLNQPAHSILRFIIQFSLPFFSFNPFVPREQHRRESKAHLAHFSHGSLLIFLFISSNLLSSPAGIRCIAHVRWRLDRWDEFQSDVPKTNDSQDRARQPLVPDVVNRQHSDEDVDCERQSVKMSIASCFWDRSDLTGSSADKAEHEAGVAGDLRWDLEL